MSWRDELTRRFPALSALEPPVWVVGGAIRDLLAGREPADVDLACLDPLAAARRISPRVIRLGTEEHLSAWRVVDGGHVYDFAALLEGNLDADLARRDFTVNAMAVALPAGELLDPHGGRADLESGTVRMIDASNFDDDPLRTLKAVRMAVRFDMEIDGPTLEAIRTRAGRIASVAPERVNYELSVIFASGRFRKAVDLLGQTNLAAPLGLQLRDVAADDVTEAGAMAILAGDPQAHARRWRWSEALLRRVTTLRRLIGSHGRIELYDAGEEVAAELPAVLRALGRDPVLDLPDFTLRPLLTGEDIAALRGIEAGKEVGRLKRAMLEAQIRGEVRSREEAEAFVRSR